MQSRKLLLLKLLYIYKRRRPIVHQPAPPLEQVRAGISGFDLILDHVRQRRLDDLARVIRLLGRPVPEARTKAVRDGADLQVLEQPRQRHIGQPLPAPAREHQRMAVAERSRRVEDLFGTPAQGNPVFPLCLRARGRDGPYVALRVDLGPLRPADLTGSRRREHEELECELHHERSTQRLHCADGRRHVAMGQRPHVLDQILLRAQNRPDAVARVVNV